MDMHDIELPRRIIIGAGSLKEAGHTCKSLGLGQKVLLITGPHIIDIAGQPVLESLEAEGFSLVKDVVGNVDAIETERLTKKARDFNFIIGIGGGRIIDIAKYCSFKVGIPFVSIPTAPSHDGIASGRATLRDNNGQPFSYKAKAPLGIIADLDILAAAPYRLIASGCADMIAKITAIADWRMAYKEKGEYFSDYAAALALLSAEIVLASAQSIKAHERSGISNLMEALISSGVAMCIAGSSRPGSGSEHLFSHALDSALPLKGSTHGEQCGVGSILAAYLLEKAGELKPGSWIMIQQALKSLGCPTTAKELDLKPENVIKALVAAPNIRPERYTIFHKVKLSEQSAEKLAKITGVI